MTEDQVKLVQQTFAEVAPTSEQAAVIFYDRLFEVAPGVKAMFPSDMTEQRKKLMGTLAVVVNGLSNLSSVLPAASALAKRHVGYAPRPSIIRWSAAHYCGPWRKASAKPGRLTSPPHGLRPTARCPAT